MSNRAAPLSPGMGLAGQAAGGFLALEHALMMTGLMVAVYGYNVGLWPTMAMLPAPLNRPVVFTLMSAAFLLLGWQAHVPLTVAHVSGIGLGLVAAAIGILVGRRLAPLCQGSHLNPRSRRCCERRERFCCCY